jgi:hypothetical protein
MLCMNCGSGEWRHGKADHPCKDFDSGLKPKTDTRDLETRLRQDLGMLEWQIRDFMPTVDSIRAEYRKELEGWLLGEGAPEDKEYHKLEKCWYCGRYQYSCACEGAFNQSSEAWRQHIHNVLKGPR